MRVQIKPALRQLWRGPGTVQIGLDPRFGTVLDGLTSADRELLEQLTGGFDDTGGTARSGRPTRDRDRERQLLRLLGDAGVLVQSRAGRATHSRLGPARDRLAPDAAVWSVVHGRRGGDGWELMGARARRLVEVVGGGRTGSALALTLACAGVGRVLLRDGAEVNPADVGPASARPTCVGEARQTATRAAIVELTGRDPGAIDSQPAWRRGSSPGPPSSTAAVAARGATSAARGDLRRLPDVVVLVEHGAADAAITEGLVGQDVAHLSVVLREATVLVGPLVVPGAGPCVRCLDLHRSDRDPAWPRVLAQLLAARRSDGRSAPEDTPEEIASSQLAASLAALQVLGHLDGFARPAAAGATLEVELPDGLVSRRDWPAHPACGCHWPPSPTAVPGQDGRRAAGTATMAP